MKKAEKSKRGGARPGAGRKSAGTEALLVRPLIETIGRLRARAKAEGKTLGQVIDGVI